MNKPLQNILLLLTLLFSAILVSSHYYIIRQSEKNKEIIQRQQLEITVYKNELAELQERFGVADENQNKDEVEK